MKGGGFMERSASDSPYHERKIKRIVHIVQRQFRIHYSPDFQEKDSY